MIRTARSQAGMGFIAWLIVIAIGAGLLFAAYIWAMLSWDYSDGERAGWVQKLSRSGYVCKTWEGEMAMVSLPGSVPEKFFFTVRDEQVAQQINVAMGKRVALNYEQHMGLPSSCFGDTGHFVTGVRVIDEAMGGPMSAPAAPVPSAPGMPSAQPQPSAPPVQK